MRIAVDTTPLHTGHKDRGVGTYTRLLCDALTRRKDVEVVYFDRSRLPDDDIDIVHYPYFDPFFVMLPWQMHHPTVVTVHDLIPVKYMHHFTPGVRGLLKWSMQRFLLRRMTRIITDSHASKTDITMFAGIDQSLIDVVHLAPASSFSESTAKKTKTIPKAIKKLGIDRPYVLYVGDINWNKNILTLLEAFAAIKAAKKAQNLQLVLAGGAFVDRTTAEARQISDMIQTKRLARDVVRPGYVADDVLVQLYTQAEVYVQLSIAEGFGLPVLEAMACGCPVVVSSSSSLVEIAGPGVQVDSTSVADVVTGIMTSLGESRQTQSKEARAWAKSFTWERVAGETINSYKSALVTRA